MTGKVLLGVFGLLVIAYGGAWVWRLMGGIVAVAGFGALAVAVVQKRRKLP